MMTCIKFGGIKGGTVKKYKWMQFLQSHFTGRPIQFVRGATWWDRQPGVNRYNWINKRKHRKDEQQPLFYRTLDHCLNCGCRQETLVSVHHFSSFWNLTVCMFVTLLAEMNRGFSASEAWPRWPWSICCLCFWVWPCTVVFLLLWTPPTYPSSLLCWALWAALFHWTLLV